MSFKDRPMDPSTNYVVYGIVMIKELLCYRIRKLGFKSFNINVIRNNIKKKFFLLLVMFVLGIIPKKGTFLGISDVPCVVSFGSALYVGLIC